jgi:hypothetical protein
MLWDNHASNRDKAYKLKMPQKPMKIRFSSGRFRDFSQGNRKGNRTPWTIILEN